MCPEIVYILYFYTRQYIIKTIGTGMRRDKKCILCDRGEFSIMRYESIVKPIYTIYRLTINYSNYDNASIE